MGKAFEENEFTHNLGLDRSLRIVLHFRENEELFAELSSIHFLQTKKRAGMIPTRSVLSS